MKKPRSNKSRNLTVLIETTTAAYPAATVTRFGGSGTIFDFLLMRRAASRASIPRPHSARPSTM